MAQVALTAGLIAASLLLCHGARASLPAGPPNEVSDTERSAVSPDPLAEWRSPAAGPLLTRDDYGSLNPDRRVRRGLDGDGDLEELLLVPFDAGGTPAVSIVVLDRRSYGYRSAVLLNCYAAEFEHVRLLRLRVSGRPQVVVARRDGSGGFLHLDVFGWRHDRMRRLWSAEGVYHGRYRLRRPDPGMPYELRLTRSIPGDANAFPSGRQVERFRWHDDRFALTARYSTAN